MTDNQIQPQKSKAVYLLPNLITTAALLSGFSSVLASINHQFEKAAILIFVAMLLDGLDGRIARLTKTESSFGEQYDSLSDLIAFGVAPAIIIYQWSLTNVQHINWLPEKLSWMIPFVYCACAALRLARFNTQVGTINPRYFIGLPSPSAAGTVAGFVWLGVEYQISGQHVLGSCLFITFFTGILMVAPIKYFSFKKVNLNNRVPFIWMLGAVVILALIAMNPATTLWLIFTSYTIHAPILRGYLWLKRKQQN